MPSLPNPYVLLAAAGIWVASMVAVFFWSKGIEANAWKAATAVQEQAASALYIDALNRNAALESSNAEFSRNLDTAHETAIRDLDATRDDFSKRLRVAARGACGAVARSSETTRPGVSEEPATGGLVELSGLDVESLERITDGAMRLALYARQCHEFAERVGR